MSDLPDSYIHPVAMPKAQGLHGSEHILIHSYVCSYQTNHKFPYYVTANTSLAKADLAAPAKLKMQKKNSDDIYSVACM